MIRRLIILLLIVGGFAQEQEPIGTKLPTKSIMIKIEKYDIDGIFKSYDEEILGEFEGILNNKIYIRASSGKLYKYKCSDVVAIYDNEMKPIYFDCSINTITKESLDKTSDLSIISSSLIIIGGYLLHTYPDDPYCISNECESLDDYKAYANKKQFQWRAGIIFISLGGILVALGI